MHSCSKPAVCLVARMLGFLDASIMESRSCPPRAQAVASDAEECCFQIDKKQSHINIDGDYISYDPEGSENGIGVWKSYQPICPETSYFEVDIVDIGLEGNIAVGLCLADHPVDTHIGYSVGSVALNTSEFRLIKDGVVEKTLPIGLGCDDGDHIGCGVHFHLVPHYNNSKPMLVPVFFTKNGREDMKCRSTELPCNSAHKYTNHLMLQFVRDSSYESRCRVSSVRGKPDNDRDFCCYTGKKLIKLGTLWVSMPPEGLYPAISLNSLGEEVRVMLGLSQMVAKPFRDDYQMVVDGQDDDWSQLSDVQIRGALLEYSGQGKSKTDVGLAQARFPLDTTAHYFEVEIVDPGENCYIAVGLTKKDYPKHRHPGWNKGSIAYHADDGKIFIESSIGDPFGPRCNKGDRMGCGIYFPSNFTGLDGDFESGDESSPTQRGMELIDWSDSGDNLDSDRDGDSWCSKQDFVEVDGKAVKVFFTRNGKVIGMRRVPLPNGGFFPSVGMMGANEKVRVNLRPLTG